MVPGEPAELLVLEVPGPPTFGGVFRAVETDIALVSTGGRTWLRRHGELLEVAPRGKRPGRRRRGRPPPRGSGRRRSAT